MAKSVKQSLHPQHTAVCKLQNFLLLPVREEGLGHSSYQLFLLKRPVKTVQWNLGKSTYFIVPLFPFLLLKIIVQELEGKVTHFYIDN